MNNRVIRIFLALGVSTLACSEPHKGSEGGTGGSPGTGGGSGSGGRPGTGGSGAGTGGSSGTGGNAGTGGSVGTGGSSAGTGGSTGTGGGAPGTGGGGGAATDGGADTGASDTPSIPPGDGTQGPTALGKIVYNQDFENGMTGISLSPNNLPPDRVAIVPDPLGKRGKVISVTWKSGDNFRTSMGTQPRSWISNAKEGGYQIKAGTKVSIAWGQMWPDTNMEAFFAQTIGPGPVWELRLRANGTFNILCNKCGGNQDYGRWTPNRWYDIRVDMDWQDGGAVRFYVDGQMVRQATVTGVGGANCHWDGGIYNTPGGTAMNKTRVTYISNLSIGER